MQEKIIYKIKTGSYLYGLNTPESDEDFGGIVLPTPRQLLGTHKVQEVDKSSEGAKTNQRNTKDDRDEKYYTLDRFLYLLSNANPNIVEFLFCSEDSLLIDSDIMRELRANSDKFITQRVWHSFTGYAYAQRKKLVTKKERYESLLEAIKLLEEEYPQVIKVGLPIDDVLAETLNSTIKYYKGAKENCESFHRGMDIKMIYDKFIAERDRYGWRLHTDSFEKLGYDTKFAYHLIRLLAEGEELLRTGKVTFPITGETKQDIMNIRNGKVSYEKLLTMYEQYYKLCEKANKNNTLRKKPDYKWIDEFQYKTYLAHIKEETCKEQKE